MDNIQKTTYLNNDSIHRDGVAIIELKGAQAYHGPITSPHYIISLCDSGYIDMEYDSVPERFTPHDLAILYPQHTCIARQATPDYHITLIIVSADLYAKMSSLNFSNKRFVYEQVPHFHLTDSQYEDVLTYIDTIRRILRLDLKNREDMLVSCIYTLTQIIDHYHDTDVGPNDADNKRLSNRFYNAIIEHCHQHRDVQFYADLFCLSPKHFSSIVKQQTGHSAGHWIQHYLLIRLKQALIYEPETSIQAIADRFGFSEQASFARYFKQHTGMTPTEYRTK